MANIVPKLNLNKTPHLADNNSLIFAKNIRVDANGSIKRDYALTSQSKGYDTLFHRINHDIKIQLDDNHLSASNQTFYKKIYDNINLLISDENRIESETPWKNFKSTQAIVGIVPSPDAYYLFVTTAIYYETENRLIEGEQGTVLTTAHNIDKSFIIKYDEKTKLYSPCNCNWQYSGGTINGCVTTNLYGDVILTIGESFEDNTVTKVPLKHINLNKSSYLDDQSIYTQMPNIPLTNLNLIGNFAYTIPNGVYQFFIRYEISDEFYTNWFPASKECFVGNQNVENTNFGSLRYIDTTKDSGKSFIFEVEHLLPNYKKNYKSFQIGFILSNDSASYARAWKNFTFDVTTVNFDYRGTEAEEVQIEDMIKSGFNIYNVGNISKFKDKLYIANYNESNFDQDLKRYADKVNVDLKVCENTPSFGNKPINTSNINGESVIVSLGTGQDIVYIGGEGRTNNTNTIIKNLFSQNNIGAEGQTLTNILTKICSNEETPVTFIDYNDNHCHCSFSTETLEGLKNKVEFNLNKLFNPKKINFGEGEIIELRINDDIISLTYQDDNETIQKKSGSKLANDILNYINNKIYAISFFGKFINSTRGVTDTFKISLTRTCEYTVTATERPTYGKSKNSIVGNNPNDTSTNLGDNFHDVNSGHESSDNDEHGGSNNPSNPNITPGSGGGAGGGDNLPDKNVVTEEKREVDVKIKYDYYQDIILSFSVEKDKITTDNIEYLTEYTTLIPLQKYKFFIHYVTSKGEITNGYYCSKIGELEIPFEGSTDTELINGNEHIGRDNEVRIIYPIFKNIQIPEGYSACFFSILHSSVNVSSVANIEGVSDVAEGSPNYYEGDCIDLNLGLLSNNQKLLCTYKVGEEFRKETVTYYHSSDTNINRYFGANGIVKFNAALNDSPNEISFITTDYESQQVEYAELVKCTPFINNRNSEKTYSGATYYYKYSDFTNMNLMGYISAVTFLDRDTCINYYSDGSSVYKKKDQASDALNKPLSPEQPLNNATLVELKEYNDADFPRWGDFGLVFTEPVLIYSNYNLNYLSVGAKPTLQPKTIYNTSRNDNNNDDTIEKKKFTHLYALITSLTASEIYSLPSMYKEYVRKTYTAVNNERISRFDNTIRSSLIEGDESRISIFTFDANDYYNIPTEKGKIVNLASVGENIIVHTESSMFRFSGTNTLQANQGNVNLSESTPFDTGIAEVFGSDYGYAGLQNKKHQIVTENGYIFFDKDAATVYIYGGNNQIVKLSDSIEKLLNRKSISDVSFANDYYNNRFFISIMFDDDKPVTISYNFGEGIKSFVSLHDFYFSKSFNTKTKCYFISNDNSTINYVDKTSNTLNYVKNTLVNDDIYYTYQIRSSKYCIIDVIVNDMYEVIKTLNAVTWFGKNNAKDFVELDDNNITTKKMAESVIIGNNVPCLAIQVYTDTCCTDVISCNTNSNDKDINNVDSYKYPRYNQGKWTLNYFRNKENTNDIFNYLERNYDNRGTGSSQPIYRSDNNSLIEGKYFVVRFIYSPNVNFSLDNITLNYDSKL